MKQNKIVIEISQEANGQTYIFKASSPEELLDEIMKQAENPKSDFTMDIACDMCVERLAPVLIACANELLKKFKN